MIGLANSESSLKLFVLLVALAELLRGGELVHLLRRAWVIPLKESYSTNW